jgi:DNA-binding SARP family transcriptional activator
MVRLFTLGSVALYDREGAHLSGEATQSKRLALLAYLATGTGLHRRDKLVALLWPESDHVHARASLNSALHYLRSQLGEEALESVGRESVRLDLERVHVDAWYFRKALEAGDLETALGLYGGDFLDGVFLSGLEELEEWVEHERRELRSDAEGAARQLTDVAVAEGRVEDAVRWARRAVELAPLDGAAVGRLIELTADSGDRVGALRIFREFESTLAAEFGIEAPEELKALIERVRDPTPMVELRPRKTGEESATPARGSVLPLQDPAPGPPSRGSLTARADRLPLGVVPSVLLLVAVAVSVVTVVVMRWSEVDSGSPLLPVPVAVAPFENSTGDRALDEIAAELQAEIAHRVARTTSGEVLASSSASAESTLVVRGEIRTNGDSILFLPRLTDGRADGVGRPLSPISADRSGAFGRLDHVADRVAAIVASHVDFGPEASLYNPPPTVAAHQAYHAGVELQAAGQLDRAVAYYARASGLAPGFVRPLLATAHIHNVAGRFEDAARVLALVERMRKDLRTVETRELEYHLAATGADPRRTVGAVRRLASTAPAAWSYEAGLWELRVNRPVAALEYFERVAEDRFVGAAQDREGYWSARSEALHRLGRDEEALQVALEGRSRFPESHRLLEREIAALAGLSRVVEVGERVWESNASNEWMCVWRAALELRAHGQAEAARQAARSAVGLTTDPLIAVQVLLHFEGREDEARARIRELVQAEPDNLDYLGMSGVLAARHDEPVFDLDHRLETWDQPGIRGENTMWRAKIAAARGERISAVRLLSQAHMEGMYFSASLHRDPDLESLRGYHAFQEFMRPRDAPATANPEH